jgi:thiol-disulfide isomerase/thioredoxin
MSKTIAIDGETSVASKVATPSPKVSDKKDDAGRRSFVEITQPAGFVNTDGEPVTIDQYIGKKVILVSFMTYSCSNCQATFPYINAWYEKYASDGFIVIGIHTPEFAFEKDLQNVILAMQKYGVTYPVVLDNEYATWKAYGNRYWPHEYLIDIHGNIVYDHIGEGAYEATESRILEALEERKSFLGI